MTLRFLPLDQSFVDHLRRGGGDAYGQPAETEVSGGSGSPCRSCLDNVPDGQRMLILTARPFPQAQPYAEIGPVFLCADACTPWAGAGVPPVLKASPDYLVKGYSAEHRIVYGSGSITPAAEICLYAETLFERTEVAYVDVHSARNNCYHARIIRDQDEP